MRHLALCKVLSRRVIVLHFAKDVANDFPREFIDGDLWKRRVASHVIQPVAKVVVLGQIVEIAVLHLQQVCGFSGPNTHHLPLIFLKIN